LNFIKYNIQIATREDFKNNNDGSSSIVYDINNISYNEHIVENGILLSGRYYWRVKAFDGYEYSDNWSRVGRFNINTPPTQPKELYEYH
jgi:hypothetical protein